MNKFRGLVLALGVGALAFSASGLRAKGAPQEDRGGPMEMLKSRLGLSKDQVSRLDALMKEGKESRRLLADKVKEDKAALAVLVDQKASDSELKSSLSKLESDQDALRDQMEKDRQSMKEVLTPLQQAKFILWRDRGWNPGGHPAPRMGRRPGGPRVGGGGPKAE